LGAVRILLADEQSLFREALRVVFDREPDLCVVAEASDSSGALAEAERVDPDVAIIDADLPAELRLRSIPPTGETLWSDSGLYTAQAIKQSLPGCGVLVLSPHEDGPTLISSLEAGATGYCPKTASFEELIEATRSVARGEMAIPRSMLAPLLTRLLARRNEQEANRRLFAKLTRREREVLALLARGENNESIARHLTISQDTARTHVQNILGKLGVHSRLAAAAIAVRHQLPHETAYSR
jgi:DNA-binding NarL/FixJ family response regulator